MRFVASVGADKRVLLSLEAAAEVLRPVLTAVGSKAFAAAGFQVHTASLCNKDGSAVSLCDAMHVHMLQGILGEADRVAMLATTWQAQVQLVMYVGKCPASLQLREESACAPFTCDFHLDGQCIVALVIQISFPDLCSNTCLAVGQGLDDFTADEQARFYQAFGVTKTAASQSKEAHAPSESDAEEKVDDEEEGRSLDGAGEGVALPQQEDENVEAAVRAVAPTPQLTLRQSQI